MTLALYGKSRRRQVSLVILALFAVLGALAASASMLIGANAASVTPIAINSGNPTCSGLATAHGGGQTWLEFKIPEQPKNKTYYYMGKTITITNAGKVNGVFMFDWSSNFGVDAVFVKQGSSAHNLYVYAPNSTAAEPFSDTRLQPQAGPNQGGISHVSFCFDSSNPPTPTPTTVTPTATPTEVPDGNVQIKKVIPQNTTHAATTFTGTTTMPGVATWSLEVPANNYYAITPGMSVAPGTYSFAEDPAPTGWTLVGYYVSQGTQVACSSDRNDYSASLTTAEVKSNETTLICVYNEPTTQVVKGTLIVKKVVVGQPNDTTPFTINVSKGGTAITDSPATLASGGSKSFSDLDLGTYEVAEGTLPAGYTLLGYKVLTGDATCAAETYDSSAAATLSSTAPIQTVCVFNEKEAPPPTGSLTVTKVVDWSGAPPVSSQTFQICISPVPVGQDACKTVGYNGGTATWTGLPIDDYTVSETNPGVQWTVTGSGVKVGVTAQAGGQATITNTLKKGSLAVTKNVVLGGAADPGETFTVCITGLSYPAGNCQDVKGGQTATWTDLIPGQYAVSETDPGSAWTVTGAGNVVVKAGEAKTHAITNTLEKGSLKVTKVLEGAESTTDKFEICITGPSHSTPNCKTTSGGDLTWSDLIPGSYNVVESTPGARWQIVGSNNINVNVPAGGQGTATITNKYLTQDITFKKFVCDSYSDVPGNPGTGGSDDRGKPSQWGFDMTLGATNTDTANPSQFSNCSESNEGWSFTLYPSQGDANNNTNSVGGANAGQTLPLNETQANLALQGQLWVKESYRPVADGFGFGVLKCYTDQLNNDNLEFVKLDRLGTEGVYCIAANVVEQTRDVQVCKVVEQNNDGVEQGGNFKFDVRWPDTQGGALAKKTDVATNGVVEGGDPVCTTVEVPAGRPVQVVEWSPPSGRPANWDLGDAAGYPQYNTNLDGTRISNGTTAELGTDVNVVTFFNKAKPLTGTLIVKKVVTNVDGDTTVFDVTLGSEGPNGSIAEAGPVNATFENLLPDTYTVTEQPENGYVTLGWALAIEGVCPAEPGETPTNQLALTAIGGDTNVASAAVVAGQDTVICFYNEAVGSLKIVKKDQTTIGGGWIFSVDGPVAVPNQVLAAGNANPGAEVTINNLPLGDYSVIEVNGSQLAVCPSLNTVPGNFLTTQTLGEGGFTLDTPGETITFEFLNQPCDIVLGSGNLQVQKVEDLNGNGVKDPGESYIEWTANIDGPEFAGGQDFTLTGGSLTLPGIEAGTYHVTEATNALYTLIGVRVNGGSLTAAGEVDANVVNGKTTTVTFYNQPHFDIEVRKTVETVDGSFPGQGWTFTLSGCGIEPVSQSTGAAGKTVFTGLELPNGCTYTVTETQEAGWKVAGSASQVVPNASAGGTAVVMFTNIRIEDKTPTPTPTTPTATPTTPTSTPTTPTETPTTPTETPTETETPTVTSTTEPQQPSSPSPSPSASPTEDKVAGDRTPGAPNAGTGLFGGSGGSFNLLLALAGLASVTAGFGLLALRSRRS